MYCSCYLCDTAIIFVLPQNKNACLEEQKDDVFRHHHLEIIIQEALGTGDYCIAAWTKRQPKTGRQLGHNWQAHNYKTMAVTYHSGIKQFKLQCKCVC